MKPRNGSTVAEGFVSACAECGSVAHDRQYLRLLERHTCEHCLLSARKRRGGLDAEPYEMFVEALAEALDLRERETGLHSKRVATHTLLLAAQHYDKVDDLREIYWGGLLHDIGKIGVPDAVLLKPGKLTPQEWVEMRKHPDIGFSMIAAIPFLTIPSQIVLSHQERWDSQGYPRNLRGPEIHIGARVFAVADTLDAMTSDRPYRKGTTFANAIAEISRCSGTQFDPEVVKAFLDIGEPNLVKIRDDMIARRRAAPIPPRGQ